MKLSVIIPCYNCADTISIQLDALMNQRCSEPWEVIFSDNGSTDESRRIVKNYMDRLPNLRIVDASARQGQPYALNIGAQAALGESLLFCDADDEVAPGWLNAMYEALKKYDFVACRIDGEKLNPPWAIKSRGSFQSAGIQGYSYPPYLPHSGGGTIGVKRWLFDAVNGFDESFPLLHDTDFCWKIQLKGVSLNFVPEAVMHVRFRNTMKGIYRQAVGYGEYNVKLYKIYLPLGMPKITWKGNASAIFYLLKITKQLFNIHNIHDKGERALFLWRLGWEIGRIKGSLKYRSFAI